jgi:PRTRC genetic system protein B
MSKNEPQTFIIGPMGVRAEAAIYFVDDQFLFHGVEDSGAEQIKFVSSGSVREAFANEGLDTGWLPPGVNRYGIGSRGIWMVRWHDPTIYTMRLEGRKTPLRVPMPSLIWFGIKNNFYIFAAREKRFTPRATLYRAPLANVNHHGLICFGKEDHPDVVKGGFERAWKAFWESEFNDHHDDGKSKRHPESINPLIAVLARAKARSYPVKDLVSMNTSLESAIERLTRTGNQ